MKKLITLLLLSLSYVCYTQNDKDVNEYYDEICRKLEYGGRLEHGAKFKEDVKIFVDGEKNDELISELNKIIYELNELIESINISITTDVKESNLLIYFGDPEKYMRYVNDYTISETLENNWGAFWFYRGVDRSKITLSEVFINTVDSRTIKQQKHLLREELTQSLGFPNDSYKYENSIFQQKWTEINEFSELDKKIIKMHYKT